MKHRLISVVRHLAAILHGSIKARLITIVVLSQTLLAAGLLFSGIFYTRQRLLSTLDAGMQARAMSVAALVRYSEDASGNVYFDNSLMPSSLDPAHPDLFAVWAERSGLLTRSSNWPAGLEIPPTGPGHWKSKFARVHYRGLRVSQVPVLDREEGKSFRPQSSDDRLCRAPEPVGRPGQASGDFHRALESAIAGGDSSAGALGHPARALAAAGISGAGWIGIGAQLGVASARRRSANRRTASAARNR